MTRVRIKICGVRSVDEARTALDLGADALGFNFWPRSPRYISPDNARQVISQLPPVAAFIGVFVDEDAQRIINIAAQVGLGAVQLHGDESPEFCALLGSIKVIKALRVGRDFDIARIRDYRASAILLDARVEGNYGGTGHSFDWDVAVAAKQFAPIILAGGLTAENVGDAIRRVQPLAVDVCSGVEAEPGRKDPLKMRAFVSAVRAANAPNESPGSEHTR
ncbi:MAG TPA: phosphoribosylanthranilate isomerase [Blastocatellia bacterium]|nr:phosphoribosylanthranilate isomerase [Blastocatellia bacterium]